MFGSSSTMRIRRAMAPVRASGRLDQRRSARERKGKREAGSLAGATHNPHAAAEVLDYPAADVQPEPAALRLSSEHIAHLTEFLEDDLLVCSADADAVIGHVHAQETALVRERNGDLSRRMPGKLGGVRQKIEHDLHQAVPVRN